MRRLSANDVRTRIGGRRARGVNRPGRGDPVHDRHLEIHEDDVGGAPTTELDRLGAVRRHPDELQVRLG